MSEGGENELLVNSFKVKDTTIKERCQTEEWVYGISYLLLQNYIYNSVSIGITNNNHDKENKSFRKHILGNYEITRRGDDCMLCDLVNEMLNNNKK